MLGNPPWERVKLQEQEFFAARDEDIAKAPNAAARKRLIEKLRQGSDADVRLYDEFIAERRRAEGMSAYLRLSGRYPLNGRGDVNTYTVLAELFRSMTDPTGRSGVIVPTGIATDATTQYFFKDLVETGSLSALYDFENTKKLFADVDSRTKFCILSTTGRALDTRSAHFAFFLNDPLQIDGSRFTLTPEEITLLNPNTGTVPIFRTRRDAEITLGIYRRVPVLINASDPVGGNPWGVSFMTMFHMSNDSHLFHTRDELESSGWGLRGNVFERGQGRMVPLYQGRFIQHYNHRADTEGPSIDPTDERSLVIPQYWVDMAEVNQRFAKQGRDPGPIYAFRNIGRSTDVRSHIGTVIPFGGVGNSAPVLMPARADDLAVVQAALSSFAFDYVVRQKLGSATMNFFIVEQIPVPVEYSKLDQIVANARAWVDARVSELDCTATDLTALGGQRGSERAPFIWSEARRAVLKAELDAAFFHLYGLARPELEHILDAFPIVKRKDESEFGEYRTKRLILENYDKMQECIDKSAEFVSTLEPVPGFGARHSERTIDE